MASVQNSNELVQRVNQLSIAQGENVVCTDVKPPPGLHFHFKDSRECPFDVSITGKPWTGKFESLLCLVENPYGTFAVLSRRTGVRIPPAELASVPESDRNYISRVDFANRVIMTNLAKFPTLEDIEKFLDDDVRTPLDVMEEWRLRPLFHSYLKQASWNDFSLLYDFHWKYEPEMYFNCYEVQ